MTTARAPFRAGGPAPGRETVPPGQFDIMMESHATGVKTLLADVSEFEPQISDAAYLAWSRAVVIRAAYGASHDDRAWYGGQRRQFLHDGGVQFLGIYQYVTAFESVTAQAREFCRLIGSLRPGEYPIADIEEGSGDQSGRRAAWNSVVASELGFTPGTGYSGLFFARDHHLAPVEWVAAYQNAEPDVPHLLWQFTDAFPVPGAGQADCSVFNGPVSALAAHAFAGQPAPPPAAPPFPYPDLDYLGQESRDPHCHSGFWAADRPHIRTWQARMHVRGWAVPVSGYYGAATERVCRQFQAEKGLVVDGLTGRETWAAAWLAPVT